MYLRKSSEAEDRQQLSIPAQERELRELAARNGHNVVGQPIAEAMSAKRPGRPGFAELMNRIARHEADGILVWALDRLARNPIDGGSLMWALGEKQIQSIVAPDRTYTGSGDDKLMMSIMFGMATKFSDDLSKNIRRGNRQALLSGRWPGTVPMGYVRAHDKALVPDPESWDNVRRIWDLRLAGVPVREILRRANDIWGFRTPSHGRHGRRKLMESELYYVFCNRLYAGRLRFGGEDYQGSHLPMVSATEFARVRELTVGRLCAPPQSTTPFQYRRLLRCGRCHAMVTAEATVNRYGTRYLYYHCARRNRTRGHCSERSVEESELERQLFDFLGEVSLPADVVQLILEELDHQANQGEDATIRRVAGLRQHLARVDGALVNLRRMRAEGEVKVEDFLADQEHYTNQRAKFMDEIKDVGSHGVVEPLKARISLLSEAKSRFEAADPPNRRQFLMELCSNLELSDQKVLILAQEPFESLRRISTIPNVCTH